MSDDNDTPPNPEDSPEDFRQHARQQAIARPVPYEDFYSLLGRYPYLEISHAEATHYPTDEPQIKQSSVGWKMHCYKQLMVSSQAELVTLLLTGVDLSDAGIETTLKKETAEMRKRLRAEAKGEVLEDAIDKSAKRQMEPVGTIVNQFFITACEMVALAKQANWPGLRIIRGYYPMQRAAWIACETLQFSCAGFEPTPEDHVVYSWVKSLSESTIERIAARPGMR